MEISDVWIPISMFASFALVLCLWLYFRFRARREFQQTVRSAIERGHELTPDLLERLGHPQPSGSRDLRRGAIAIGIGLGLAAFGLLVGEDDAVRPLIAIGAVPFLVGLAYLALWRFTGETR